MNNCQCFMDDNELNLYLDRELPRERTEELGGHIAICDGCAARYEIVVQLKRLLANSVMKTKVPAGLRERIAGQVGAPESRGVRFREALVNFFRGRLLIPIGAASFIAIAFMFFLFPRLQAPESGELVNTMVEEHNEYIISLGDASGIQSGDPAEVARWLTANSETRVDLSNGLALPGLCGACALDEGGRRITCLFFDQGEKRVSLFVIAGEPAAPWGERTLTFKNTPLYTGCRAEDNYVAWSEGEVLRVLVSRIPEEDLINIARRLM